MTHSEEVIKENVIRVLAKLKETRKKGEVHEG